MIEFIEDSHTYLYNGVIVPSVSEIMNPISVMHYENISKSRTDVAKVRGTAIHKATECIDKGEEYTIDDKWKNHVLQYKKFLALRKPEILEIEMIVTDGTYCGTLDRIYIINGETWMVDIKSSAVINEKLVKVQLAGYKKAQTKHKIDRYGVLHLTSNNFKLKEVVPNDKIFGMLLEIYKYGKGE